MPNTHPRYTLDETKRWIRSCYGWLNVYNTPKIFTRDLQIIAAACLIGRGPSKTNDPILWSFRFWGFHSTDFFWKWMWSPQASGSNIWSTWKNRNGVNFCIQIIQKTYCVNNNATKWETKLPLPERWSSSTRQYRLYTRERPLPGLALWRLFTIRNPFKK